MTLKEMEAKIDAGALISDMNAELKFASDRWEEVCRTYGGAWKDAYDIHSKVLQEIHNVKEARRLAEAAAISACLQLACVFLPMIGGTAALTFAPILSTRAKLLVSTMSKRASAKWTSFATNSPIAAQVVKQIGEVSSSKAKEAAEKIQTSIVQALAPKAQEVKAQPAVTDPATEFINNSRQTLDTMNAWVRACAKWNVNGGVERLLIPVAHEMFMNHPWVKTAPKIEATQKLKAPMTGLIEMALWLRWARSLNEQYWERVHDTYENEYRLSSPSGQEFQSRGKAYEWVVDALDFQPVWFRLEKITGHQRMFNTLTLISPKTRMGHPTIDLHMLQKVAKNRSRCQYLLEKFVPQDRKSDELLRELARM